MRGLRRSHFLQLSTVASLLMVCSTPSAAQASRTTVLDFATGSRFEDYLRALQIAGLEPLRPWSIRGLSPTAIAQWAALDSTGPWRLRQNFHDAAIEAGSLGLGAVVNSAYPSGANDGPVWAGRGLTVVANAGIRAHIGAFSL